MKLKFVICKVIQKEAYLCAANSPNQVDVIYLPQGLHIEPDKLRQQLQNSLAETVDEKGESYDAILLGYGLCSNGILGISCDIPVVVPRAHDCITLLLGSKEKYQQYFDTHKGVYWYSCGWIATDTQPGADRVKMLLREYTEKHGADNAQYLMEMEQGWLKEYKRAVYIDWNLPNSGDDQQYTRECADFLGWDYDRVEGDNSLIQRLVDGKWDEEDFLIVRPGQTVAEDVGHHIVKAVDGKGR